MRAIRWTHLAVGVAVLAVYPFASASTQRVLYLLLSLSAPVAIIVAVRIRRPVRTSAWILLATGFALYFVGDLVYTAYEVTGNGTAPFPNPGDIAYLLFYPVVYAALGGFLRTATSRDRAAWIDASIWTVGALLLAWKPLIEPAFAAPLAHPLAGVLGLVYPLLDVGLLLMLLRIAASRSSPAPAYWLLIAGLASQSAADAVYSLQVLQVNELGGRLLDIGWLITYVMVGAAALHPSMPTMTEPSARTSLSSRARLLSLLVPTMVAPGLLAYQLFTGQLAAKPRAGLVMVGALTAMTLLGAARAIGLLSVAEGRSRQLVERQAQMEGVLADREQFNAMLHDQVNQDALTGLASRDRFVAALEAALSSRISPSIAFLDLDDFKNINDTLGHEAGDLLLVALAKRLQATVGPNDLVARFGGDEFAVLVTGDVEEVAERLIEALRRPVILHGRELRLQVSIGVTTAGVGNTSTSDMLRRADMAMYAAKRAGGGWTRYRTGMSALLRERMDLRARLVAALREGKIEPWFQPVVDIATGELRGFEALARWVPGDQRALTPCDWLPMAEETGLVVSVDRVVCRAAITQLAAWRDRYCVDDLYLAVNMSARTLQERGIAEGLIDLLAKLGVPANRIVVEVTEGVLMDDVRVSARLQMLRTAGVRVALDDFGTGWSSLSYLQRFPVDQLKLDCSFTAELGIEPGGEAIPAAVLQLARALALDVVAEGVETLVQRNRLAELGFLSAQGYLFGAAVPAHRLDALLDQDSPRHARPAIPPWVGPPSTVVRPGLPQFAAAATVPAGQ